MTAHLEAIRGADIIHHGFDDYSTQFRAITRRARERFERRDWDGIRRDTVKRLGLHPLAIAEAYSSLEDQLRGGLAERQLWVRMKEAFTYSILGRDDFELAQTFFNSLSRKVFPHEGVDPAIDYVAGDFPLPFKGCEMASARMYAAHRVDPPLMRKILGDAGFRSPFEDLAGDAALAAGRIEEALVASFGGPEIDALDVLRPVLIRNKAAYVVARARKDQSLMPVVLALLCEEKGLELDAVLCTEEEASIILSFARWYFHADIASPREVIGFLQSIVPRKRTSELYISLGYNKHGKTEFFRDLLHFIDGTSEQFVVAPGQRGLVMSVFTLPSFPYVFKVIKDFFPPSKRTTRDEIIARYREVLRHDRVGRLVDYQEFEHLKFPRGRFCEEILEELLSVASNTVSIQGDDVVIRHVFVGRRVTPLDVLLESADRDRAEAAVIDWGFCLKDLAAANFFAGDMLLKNFGVTRHGRVVFYDYDELCPLADCRFRTFPQARDYDDELASEPWFSVADEDVFPEELRTFLGLTGELRELFDRHHGQLFEVDFWRAVQDRNRQGEIIDIFPYAPWQRLRRRPRRADERPQWRS